MDVPLGRQHAVKSSPKRKDFVILAFFVVKAFRTW
jgi:hypothetical protein